MLNALMANSLQEYSSRREEKSLLEEHGQEKFAHKIVKAGLSTRQAENLAKTYQQEKGTKPLISKDPNIVNLEAELSDVLSSKVTISHQKKGSGIFIRHQYVVGRYRSLYRFHYFR